MIETTQVAFGKISRHSLKALFVVIKGMRSGKYTYKRKIKNWKISILRGSGGIDVKIRANELGRDIYTV